jgi:hypothetical protein
MSREITSENASEWKEFCGKLTAEWVARRTGRTKTPLRPLNDAPISQDCNLESEFIKSLRNLSIGPLRSQASLIQQLESAHRLFLLYDDVERQEKAREKVPVERLHSEAQKALEDKTVQSFDEGLLKALLKWFKTEFFKWTNAPPCRACQSPATQGIQGGNQPTDEERKYLANNTEVYICTICSAITRFPRYNDPVKLLETRQGRCGEWSNVSLFHAVFCTRLKHDYRHSVSFARPLDLRLERLWM